MDPFKVEGVDLDKLTVGQLQLMFDGMNEAIQQGQAQVDTMKQTYDEASFILNEMKHRRGRVAYWLTVRKSQR